MNNFSNTRAEHDLSPDERKRRDGQRRGTISRFRVVYGVKALLLKPWKLAFVAMLDTAFLFCWFHRDTVILRMLPGFPVLPGIMVPVLSYILYALIIVLFVLLLALLLCELGTPRRARKIDRAMIDIFKNDVGYGYWPIYISRQHEGNTDLWRYTFYSEHLPMEMWEAKSARLINNAGRLYRKH